MFHGLACGRKVAGTLHVAVWISSVSAFWTGTSLTTLPDATSTMVNRSTWSAALERTIDSSPIGSALVGEASYERRFAVTQSVPSPAVMA